MPNRIIKESICASEEIDALTDQQEVFFYRLMVVADDYGLMDARPAMLKAKCYPLKSIDINCIQVMLAALQALDLIRMYSVEGKRYLQITNWAKHQQIRAKRAKYPMPDQADDNTCNQLISDAPVIQSNPIQSESNPNPNPITPEKEKTRKNLVSLPAGFKPNDVGTVYAQDRKLSLADELVSFTNWHTAKGSTFKDWQAAWRTWCDKAVEFGRAKGGSPPKGYESEKDRSRREFAQAIFGKAQHEPANERDITGTSQRVD